MSFINCPLMTNTKYTGVFRNHGFDLLQLLGIGFLKHPLNNLPSILITLKLKHTERHSNNNKHVLNSINIYRYIVCLAIVSLALLNLH